MLDWWHEVRGVEPLTWAELKAWSELAQTQPNADEFKLLIELDKTFWNARNGPSSKT